VATLRAPLDGPELAGFVAQLEPLNALADQSPGFVWRLQTEDGDATAIRPFDDDRVMVNLSVWASLEALRSFVYASRHLDVMRHRRAWFPPHARPVPGPVVGAGRHHPDRRPRPGTASSCWPARARPGRLHLPGAVPEPADATR
jgi:hypothetical protein